MARIAVTDEEVRWTCILLSSFLVGAKLRLCRCDEYSICAAGERMGATIAANCQLVGAPCQTACSQIIALMGTLG